jgi:hypothetical protein
MYGKSHLQSVELCVAVFYEEYNREWPDAFEELEKWIEEHDAELEATKGKA